MMERDIMTNEERIQKIKEDRKLEYTTLRRLVVYHCKMCEHIFEWVDDRKPNFCSECGTINSCQEDSWILEEITSQIVSISNKGLENV